MLMEDLPELVKDLALILIVAGIVTLIFKRLKQPLVLGYIVAGFLVSPQMPYTASVVDSVHVKMWADIGVIFLLFSLGLDFSFKKIIKMGLAPVTSACIIIFFMMLSGMGVGNLFGWSKMDCVFLGGMLAMSSTTIIYKAFDDMGLRQQNFASMVMSVLILEDVLAIVMMVMLSAFAKGNDLDGRQMLESILRIGFFLVLWFVVGIYAIPAFLRSVRNLINDEVMLVVVLGLCCLMAVVSTETGFSSAFGAFVMGSILAETVEAEKIIRLVEPVKNLFGAIFFVSVGMLVEPQVLMEYALPIIVIVLTILIGQCIFGSFAYLVGGQNLKSAMRCGFSMAQIGEFAFIIASLGLNLGVIGDFLYPVVVAVSVITTFLTPYMIRFSSPCYNFLEKRLPKKFIVSLNNIQIAGRITPPSDSSWRGLLIPMVRTTVIYTILSIAALFLMFTFFRPLIHSFMPEWPLVATIINAALSIIIISPFLRALVMKKNHSEEAVKLWKESIRNRPLLVFTVIFRIFIAMVFIYNILELSFQLKGIVSIIISLVLVILMIMSRSLKLSSIRMENLFLKNLQSRDIANSMQHHMRPLYEGHLLDRDIHIADFDIPNDSKWAGLTLRTLGLGKKFGIHVVSILRFHRRLNIPDGDYTIYPGDTLQVIGNDEQLSKFATALKTEIWEEDLDYEKHAMHLRQIIIGEESEFNGKTLSESGIRNLYNCMVVGIEEGKENLSIPKANYRFRTGDIIWVVGETDDLKLILNK